MSEEVKKEEITPFREPLEVPNPGGFGKYVLIGILVVLIIAALMIFLTSLGDKLLGREPKGKEALHSAEFKQGLNIENVHFTTLPEILINLRTSDGRSSFLKSTFIVRTSNGEIAKKIEKLKPMIVDQFQTYLRALDIEDISGAAGEQRIRQELLDRVNDLLSPEKADEILVNGFLVQ